MDSLFTNWATCLERLETPGSSDRWGGYCKLLNYAITKVCFRYDHTPHSPVNWPLMFFAPRHEPIIPSASRSAHEHDVASGDSSANRMCSKFAYDDIREVHKRRYLLQVRWSLLSRNTIGVVVVYSEPYRSGCTDALIVLCLCIWWRVFELFELLLDVVDYKLLLYGFGLRWTFWTTRSCVFEHMRLVFGNIVLCPVSFWLVGVTGASSKWRRSGLVFMSTFVDGPFTCGLDQQNIALEIFHKDGRNYLMVFPQGTRPKVYNK